MNVLAIDPGPERSAWIVWAAGRVTRFGIDPNDIVLEMLRYGPDDFDVAAIEKVESYGMPVGAEVFETVHWSGRFEEALRPTPVIRLPRMAVKMALCHDSRAKDPNIRQALLDRFGGKTAVGTKRAPGPLYGIHGDLWAALAVAVTYCDGAAA